MAFTMKRGPKDPYIRPEQPEHIHLAACPDGCSEEHAHVPVCVDHRVESCPDEHWIGGHPEPTHPHHVEFDGATGLVGYTRLTKEEVRDLKMLDDYLADEGVRVEKAKADLRAEKDAALAFLRASKSPESVAFLKVLGLEGEPEPPPKKRK